MPNIVDVFKGDPFGVVAMTEAINLLPHAPTRLGDSGMFEKEYLTSRFATLERQENTIQLIESQPVGSPGKAAKEDKRDIRAVRIPHFPLEGEIEAESVQGVRAFGGDADQLETVANKVNDKLAKMRVSHDVTAEYIRVGALKGVVLDGDASTTLLNLFTEFGVTQKVIAFDLSTSTSEIKQKCDEVEVQMEDALGGLTYTGIHAFCGRTFWREFITHPKVEAAYNRYLEGAFLRQGTRVPFEIFNIMWEPYRAKVGDVSYIPDTDCRFAASGVPGLFKSFYAPADMVETVNTTAREFYASQEMKKHNKGWDLHTQSNHISLCTRPATLIRGHNGS